MAAESLLQVVGLFPGPALVVGPGGEVLGANDQASRWLGADRGPIAGGPLDRWLADPPDRVARFLDECRRADGTVDGVLTPSQDGRRGTRTRVEGLAIRPRSGEDGASLVVLHAPPERGEGEAEWESLREAARRKDELIDRVLHDLRNPVAAISSALHLARNATDPEDASWAQDAMARQVENLVRQLDGLLDLSRMARGRIQLREERLDAAAAARAAVAAARPMIEGRDLRITLATAPGDLALRADPSRLEQILVGVLAQVAGSAEPGGGIRLSVAREGDAVVFRARDRADDPAGTATADGPAPADEADPPSIGLMVVRALAELHGGAASMRAVGPGRGCEMVVRLPSGGVPATTAEPLDSTPPAPTPAGRLRVLVVDDNVDAARGTARLLQLAGHDVRVAHDGREALELAHAHRPLFVLLDIALPVMDGHEVARRLRADPLHRDVVIVAVSGYSQDDYHPSQEAGFDHHLVKPVDFHALRAILDRATPRED